MQKQISNASSQARFKAQNAVANIDVPFTNITTQIGNRTGKLTAPFRKGGITIGQDGAKRVNAALGKAGLAGNTAAEFLQRTIGKTDPAELTLQEYRHVQSEVKRVADYMERNPVRAPFNDPDNLAEVNTNPLGNFQANDFVPDAGGRSAVTNRLADLVRWTNPRQVGSTAQGQIVNDAGNLMYGVSLTLFSVLRSLLAPTLLNKRRYSSE